MRTNYKKFIKMHYKVIKITIKVGESTQPEFLFVAILSSGYTRSYFKKHNYSNL